MLRNASYPNDLLHAVKTIHRTSFRPGKWRLNQDDLGRRSYQAECLIKLKLEDQSLDPSFGELVRPSQIEKKSN